MRGRLWPGVELPQGFFKNEDSPSGEAVSDDVLPKLLVHPVWSAAPKHGEVRVVDDDLTTFASSLLVNHFVPNRGEEANHRTVDVLTAEEFLHLCDEGGGLPVANFFPIITRDDFILRHVIEQPFPATTLCCNWHSPVEPNEPLGYVHSRTLPHPRVSHQNNVEVREDCEVALWNTTLLSKQSGECSDGRPSVEVGRRLGVLAVL